MSEEETMHGSWSLRNYRKVNREGGEIVTRKVPSEDQTFGRALYCSSSGRRTIAVLFQPSSKLAEPEGHSFRVVDVCGKIQYLWRGPFKGVVVNL